MNISWNGHVIDFDVPENAVLRVLWKSLNFAEPVQGDDVRECAARFEAKDLERAMCQCEAALDSGDMTLARSIARSIASMIRPRDPDLWKRTTDYPVPTNRSELRAALVEAGYSTDFIVAAQYVLRDVSDDLARLLARKYPPVGHELQAGPMATPQAPAAGGDDGMTWQEAKDKADEIRLAGGRFTSYRKMAKSIGCLSSVLHDAIKEHGTVELQQWATKQRGTSKLNAAPEVAAVAFENTPQASEPNPADITEDGDVDAMLARLLDQARPDERARIHAMTPAEKRQLAETAYRDRDLEEQIDRRRRAKRSRRD